MSVAKELWGVVIQGESWYRGKFDLLTMWLGSFSHENVVWRREEKERTLYLHFFTTRFTVSLMQEGMGFHGNLPPFEGCVFC